MTLDTTTRRTALASATAILFLSGASAQTAAPKTFEVASIKPSAPSSDGQVRVQIRMAPGGRLNAQGVNVKMLIAMAYDVREAQIVRFAPMALIAIGRNSINPPVYLLFNEVATTVRFVRRCCSCLPILLVLQ